MARICVATSSFATDPSDHTRGPFIIEMIRLLVSLGHEVTVSTPQMQGTTSRTWPDFKLARFEWSSFAGRIADLFPPRPATMPYLARLLVAGTRAQRTLHAARRMDLCICLWAVPSGLFAWIHRLLSKDAPPYVVWCLGSDIHAVGRSRVGRIILRAVLRGAAARYADGFALAEEVRRISGRDCSFVPTMRLLPAPVQAAAAAKLACPTFLFVGRHEPIKGIDRLVDAAILLGAETGFALEIVGDGNLTDALKSRVALAGLGDRVRFHGVVDDESLVRLYASAGCVVIPSRNESIPLVLGESLQFSKPLIVTDVGDMGTLVRRFELGRVTDSGEPAAIAQAMREQIAAPKTIAPARVSEALALLSLDRRFASWMNELSEAMAR